jgi:hypothetical protein
MPMSAKHKLNSAYFLIAFLVADLIGGLTSSWSVFGIVLAGLLAASVIGGDIRR